MVVILSMPENYTYDDVLKPVLKFNISITLGLLIVFLLVSSLSEIQNVLAHKDILTDNDAINYY